MYNYEDPKWANNIVMNLMKNILLLILMFFTFSLSSHAVADQMEDMKKMSEQLKDASK